MNIPRKGTTVLAEIRSVMHAHGGFPPELSAARFDRAHDRFESSSDQQGLILRWLSGFVGRHCPPDEPLRMLSVGCGSGILDLPLMREVARTRDTFEYTALDPNPVALARFRDEFGRAELPGVSLRLEESDADGFRPEGAYRSIHSVHSVYYFPDPPRTLDRLLSMLTPDGHLVIFAAPLGALNRLADCFWGRATEHEVWYSDRLESHLGDAGLLYEKDRIEAKLDVTSCLTAGETAGQEILDFSIHADAGSLPGGVLELCRNYLRVAGDADGARHYIDHPVDVFVIKPKNAAA